MDDVAPVQAVRTTGIYCRPDCSAHPSPANVTEFLLPAAAEAAGYRACLRCRPYRSQPGVFLDGPELVCRAVQLVVDGALDDGTEESLAGRLGVSARHLRRLFAEHVGATPDQVARSGRVHFARRLLDDTDLPLIDVALAAGFGSVRQFNRACKEVFHATPSELRARRRRGDRLVADGGLDLRLPVTGPLDWPSLADALAARAIPGVESLTVDDDGPRYRRTVRIDGDPGVVEIGPLGSGGDLRLRLHLPHWHGLIHLVQRARRLLGADVDPSPAVELLAADPLLAAPVARNPHRRPLGCWDPFEIGVRAIVGQQVSVAAASTIAGRIAGRHGTPVPGLGPMGLSHLFPTPDILAEADLGGLGLTTGRIDAVRGFATAVHDGTVRLDRSVGLDELVGRLTSVRGLGPWTAHYVALRIGEADAFPATDLGLRRAAGLLRGGGPVDSGCLESMAERWRPWRAVAAAHLWALGPLPQNSRVK